NSQHRVAKTNARAFRLAFRSEQCHQKRGFGFNHGTTQPEHTQTDPHHSQRQVRENHGGNAALFSTAKQSLLALNAGLRRTPFLQPARPLSQMTLLERWRWFRCPGPWLILPGRNTLSPAEGL